MNKPIALCNFKQLLEESKLRVQWTITETEMPMLFQGARSAIIKDNEEVISIKTLGVWAFRNSMSYYKAYKRAIQLEDRVQRISELGAVYTEWKFVAECCLGKEEYLKNLLELC